ncbi:MAG: SRPBCC family protein [Hyphomicrobiaceae bacterium]|nr:SRPBCC family protein [Hyphomicrobiaceae bacterium]
MRLTRRTAALALTLIVSAVIVAVATAPATAHGPTRQKVAETVTINAPADKVWALVGNFQDMGWHPAIAKTEGTGENTPGAKRTLTLQSGGKIEEELTKFSAEKRSFAYEIKAVDVKVLPVNNYSASITVNEEGGKSIVEWKSAFYRGFLNNDPPPELSDEAAIKAITGVFKSGLEALKKKAEGAG